MPRVSVIRVQGDAVCDAVREAVAQVDGLAALQAGARVLIKPNLVFPSASGSGSVTDARVIEGVVQAVLTRNPNRVTLGEGSSVGYDFPGQVDSLTAMEANGSADVARRYGLPMVDLNHDERVAVRAEDAYVMSEFGVARTAWEADFIVDVPVMKTHGRTGITCALKNMKGVLPGVEKKRTHRLGLDRAIVDLHRVMRPHLTVVDALLGLSGTHTRPEDRIPMGLIVAGVDPVAVDAVCATLMGFAVDEIHHVRLAAEAGLGVADLAQIEVLGERLADVARPFQPYMEAARQRYGAVTIIEKSACTGCMGEMESTFYYLHKAGFDHRLKDLTLILGTPEEVPPLQHVPVVIGKCPLAYRDLGVYVPGCPPHGIKITEAICEALDIDKGILAEAIRKIHAGEA